MTVDELSLGLARLRKRRWCLWAVFLTYLPAIWLSLRLTGSDRATAVVFALWIALAAAAGGFAAFARCPRCGEYYHIKGLMPVWVRNCLHCGLPLKGEERH